MYMLLLYTNLKHFQFPSTQVGMKYKIGAILFSLHTKSELTSQLFDKNGLKDSCLCPCAVDFNITSSQPRLMFVYVHTMNINVILFHLSVLISVTME